MALLVYLSDNAGRDTREQLFEALWPGVIVSDDTLTQAVIKLRKALGDSAKNPQYIQTIPKRGYRLCAEVNSGRVITAVASEIPKYKMRYLVFGVVAILSVTVISFFGFNKDSSAVLDSHPAMEKETGVPTLTVRPFVLLGGDERHAYLSQALTFDLITDLSKLSGLWVIGSRSITGQKSEGQGATTARYLVSGEVQRSNDQLRVNVHLFDTDTGRQIWSERYQSPYENLFQIQEEISWRIASTLSLKVSEAERLRMAIAIPKMYRPTSIFYEPSHCSWCVKKRRMTGQGNSTGRQLNWTPLLPGLMQAWL